MIQIKTKGFKVEIGTRFKDSKRDLIITNREYRITYDKNNCKHNYKWYKYTCNRCNWTEGWMVESALIKLDVGCACCCYNPKTIVEGINDIPTTAPWMVKYFQGGYDEAKKYTKSCSSKIYPICPDCGRIRNMQVIINNIYKRHSVSCPCNDGISYPNKFMFNVLEQLSIEFETEKNFEWCEFTYNNKLKHGRYDFYTPSMNLIIEMDGGFHKGDNNLAKQTKEESQLIDKEKDRLAREHGIKVIRIDCTISEFDYIKNNILNSKFPKVFNIGIINWSGVEEFALSNRVKEACRLWNCGVFSTKEIGEIIKINRAIAIKYLKQGAKLGWCNYNPKEEMRKSGLKAGKSFEKPIRVFKDGVKLGEYPSATYLSKKSIELFGVELKQQNISRVCKNNTNMYKGFSFEYIDKDKLKC